MRVDALFHYLYFLPPHKDFPVRAGTKTNFARITPNVAPHLDFIRKHPLITLVRVFLDSSKFTPSYKIMRNCVIKQLYVMNIWKFIWCASILYSRAFQLNIKGLPLCLKVYIARGYWNLVFIKIITSLIIYSKIYIRFARVLRHKFMQPFKISLKFLY